MITKFTTQEQLKKKNGEVEVTEKEYRLSEYKYPSAFVDWILDNISRSDIEYYAENELNMIDAYDCNDCNCKSNISQFPIEEIIEFLAEEGYSVVKCNTVIDALKVDQMKEILNL